MCGIVGFVSTEGATGSINRRKFFRDALIADQVRGPHSTGFYSVGSALLGSPEVKVLKKAFNAPDFLSFKEVDKAMDSIGSKQIVIGHNRWATVGAINHDTAHPFTHGSVTMVHNGTLDYWADLEGSARFEVDSEAVCYALSVADDPKTVLEALDGAYVLVWYDTRDHKLRIARNDDRPLHVAFVKGENTMLMASESGMLKWLAEKHDQVIERVLEPQAGMMVTLELNNLRSYRTTEFKVLEYWNAAGYGVNYGKNHSKDRSKSKTVPEDNLLRYPEQFTPVEVKDMELGDELVMDVIDFITYRGNSKKEVGYLEGVVELPDGEHVIARASNLEAALYKPLINLSVRCTLMHISDIDLGGGESSVLAVNNLSEFDLDDMWPNDYPGYDENCSAELEYDTNPPTNLQYRGPGGVCIDYAEMTAFLVGGCNHCDAKMYPDQVDGAGWTVDGGPICSHCMTENGWNKTDIVDNEYTQVAL